MYHLVDDRFQPLPPNERGHFAIPRMGVELGIWEGRYLNLDLPWMRWWEPGGSLLPTGHELAEIEAGGPRAEAGRAEREAGRAERAPTSPRSSGPWASSRRREVAGRPDQLAGSTPTGFQ